MSDLLLQNKEKSLLIQKEEETTENRQFINVLKESTVKNKSGESKDATNSYIKNILKSLEDGEHINIDLESIKEKVSFLLETDTKDPQYISKLMDVSNSLDMYLDSHQGSYFFDYKQARKDNVIALKNQIISLLEEKNAELSLREGMKEENPVQDSEVFATKKEINKAKEDMSELSGYMRKWRSALSENILSNPEEIIDQKLSIYEVYKDSINIYKNSVAVNDIPKEYQKVLSDYEYLKLKKELILKDKAIEGHDKYYKNVVLDAALDVALKMDEKLINKKSMDKNLDNDLNEKQLAGINDIDRWLIRNFNNGGLSGFNYPQTEFILKILSLSKRERLYLYYMVETKARKHADLGEMVKSQDYAPNLDGFKNEMLKSKLKLSSRFTGGYIYWHKLTEAMQHLNIQGPVLESYLKEKEDTKVENWEEALEKGMKQTEKNEEKIDENDLKSLSNQRMDTLKLYFKELNVLKSAIESGKYTDEQINTIKGNIDLTYKELVEADDKLNALLGNQKYVGDLYFGRADKVTYSTENMNYANTLLARSPQLIDTFAGSAWNVRDWHWDKAWAGMEITGGSLSAISSVIGVVGGIMALNVAGSAMSNMDYAEQVTNLSVAVAKIGVGIYAAVEKTKLAGKSAANFMNSVPANSTALAKGALQTTGVVMGAISLGMAGFQTATYYNHASNLKDAKAFFAGKDKYMNRYLESKKGIYSEDDGERRLEKEARYHKNIARLSKLHSKDKRDSAILAGVLGTVALTSALIPGLGVLGLVATGAGIALGFAKDEVKFLRDYTSNYKAFDDYFNIDAIFDSVMQKKEEEGGFPDFTGFDEKTQKKKKMEYMARVKDNIRREVSAKFGFSNVEGARMYIGNQYAKYIMNKIDTFKRIKEEDRENDPELIAINDLLKSMGLSINFKKNRPTLIQIRSKLSGR